MDNYFKEFQAEKLYLAMFSMETPNYCLEKELFPDFFYLHDVWSEYTDCFTCNVVKLGQSREEKKLIELIN